MSGPPLSISSLYWGNFLLLKQRSISEHQPSVTGSGEETPCHETTCFQATAQPTIRDGSRLCSTLREACRLNPTRPRLRRNPGDEVVHYLMAELPSVGSSAQTLEHMTRGTNTGALKQNQMFPQPRASLWSAATPLRSWLDPRRKSCRAGSNSTP